MVNVLLIDTSAMFFKLFFRNDKMEGVDTDYKVFKIKRDFMEELFFVKRKYAIDKMFLAEECYSTAKRNNWRMKIYEEYKMNRAIQGEPTEDDLRLIACRREFNLFIAELTKLFRIYSLYEEGCEGDDAIASVVQQNDIPNTKFIIFSVDKDFQQLASKGDVTQISTRTFLPISKDEYNDVRLHAIIGDASDNVPHLKKGIGPKKAQKIIEDGLLEQFLSENNLNEMFERNLKLVDLSRIPMEYQTNIYEKYKSFMIKDRDIELDQCLEFLYKLDIQLADYSLIY